MVDDELFFGCRKMVVDSDLLCVLVLSRFL